MLEKSFDPADAEPRLYQAWETSGAFKPRDGGEPFSMVIPPPNVTGSLHIGHALNNTLQDVLIRFQRMRGKAALWLPGTDHAGIATQMVVERKLAAEGNVGRRELGRDAFVAKVWEWKAESGGTIVRQLRRMGASCDWSRERFTLDEGLSAAVRKVFVQLYKDGLIYRDKRLVNWDPQFQTAISDLEVEQREVDGSYWHFAYRLEDGSGEIVVATTRPETMLGDTAVAVHPDDDRYKALVGKMVRLPITGRLVPIVADEYADPEKGSGAVKITPAHDFNDFLVGKRHDLPLINVLDAFARINENGGEYEGQDRFVARKAIVARAEEEGWLRGIEKTRHMVPHGDRSGVVIEPWLTDQWYVDAKTLAQPAIKAVEDGATVFEPRNWDKTYFEWMRNIEPWCISRQLWWGHRIPAWFDEDGKFYVAETEEEAVAASGGKTLRQDEDVLDTWFSSALWPFSTLGWPEPTEDLARFYPTNTLVTSFDIIFFWVARMMMMGLHFTGEAPFKRVFINALVRDSKGQKMSKSKGNVIDPLGLVDKYGADALRFTLVAMSGQARDIKLSEQRIEGYRNFGTKLWNAARFTQMNECQRVEGFDPATVNQTINRWIRGEAVKTAAEVTRAIEACAFDDAANGLYRFIWNVFCDWYLELAKPILNGADEAAKAETRAMTAWTLDLILKLLHPVSPFLTEELWGKLAEFGAPREQMLITTAWPELPDSWIDADAETEIGWVVDLITQVRSVRSEMNVPPGAKIPLTLSAASPATKTLLARHSDLITALGRLDSAREADAPPAGSVPFVVGEATAALSIADFIDLAAERARLAKDIAGLDAEIERTAKKLDNADFVARAKEEVVTETREKLTDAQSRASQTGSRPGPAGDGGVKTRADVLLVTRGLFDSRAKAKAAIEAGGVTVGGVLVVKSSELIDEDAELAAQPAHPWVGRGALKLAHALELWSIPVSGRTVLDVGASTGGFTEVCLAQGAARVFAVDVGREQLHPSLRDDPRVTNLEGVDARTLNADLIPTPPGLIVCDASFIGLAKVLPAALGLAKSGADLVCLVKPQFEAGPQGVGKGGVVRDEATRAKALMGVVAWLTTQGWAVQATAESPITGGDGNVEFLLWARLS